jgi:hypothetical protein
MANLRRRRREKKDDPAVLARQAIADAKAQEDTKDAAASVERAVHLALQARTGLKTRGILQADLADALIEAGLDDERAAEAVDLLEGCSSLRFEPAPEETAGTDLIKRGRALIKAVLAG